jgi:DNA (cytosine-5)-methyltransferase 1
VVSLFSGAGGLDLGFTQAGFQTSVAFDSMPAAVRTFKHNFPGVAVVEDDLTSLGPIGVANEVAERIEEGTAVGIIGGPPCQGFSTANTGSRGDDPRNQLPVLFVDIVRRLQMRFDVRFVVFENVLGITHQKHAAVMAQLVDGLLGLDFVVAERKLTATEFGVAQRRTRLLVTATPTEASVFPHEPERETGSPNVRAALKAIASEPAFFARSLTPGDIPLHPNHWTMNPKSRRFAQPVGKRDGRSFKRLIWDDPSPTIAFGHREIPIHPDGHRRISLYEAQLLQGFPSTFEFLGNFSDQAELISNAVPPPVAKAIAHSFAQVMDRSDGSN